MAPMPRVLLAALSLSMLAGCQRREPAVVETDAMLALGHAEQLNSSTRTFTVGGRPILFTRLNGTAEITVVDTAEASLRFTERVPGDGTPNAVVTDVLAGPQVRFTVERGEGQTNPVDVQGVVPKGTPLEFRTEAGTVVVRNPDARVAVRMQNGTVQVSGVRADLVLDVDNGTVDASYAVLAGTQHLRTRNGSIAVYLPRSASATVSARSGVRIDVEGLDLPAPRDVQGTQRLTGGIGTGRYPMSLLATNGSILIAALPADSSR